MKKFIQKFLLIFIGLFLIQSSFVNAQDSTNSYDFSSTGWGIRSFDSNIQINKNSSINVQETIITDFTQAFSKHGIYRYIPIKYKTKYNQDINFRISDIQITDENGNSLTNQITYEGDNVNIRIGDADKLVDGQVVTYIIKYKLDRGLNQFEDHDELYWNVTGNGWDTIIAQASATVKLPENVNISEIKNTCYTGEGYSTEQECTFEVIDGQTIQFKANKPLNNYEGISIVTGFPRGIVEWPSSLQYIIWFFQDNFGYLIPIIFFFILYHKWYTKGKDPKALRSAIMPQYDPPKDLSPAEIGTLIDDKVDMRDITSTIIDLATRGWLKITEKSEKIFFSTVSSYTLTKTIPTKTTDTLLDFEKTIYEKIFSSGDEVKLSDLNNDFYTVLEKVKNQIYDGLVTKKYYDSNPDKVRGTYLTIGIVGIFLLITMSGAFIVLLNLSIYFGLFLTFILFIIFSFYMPKKTQQGVDTLIHILGLEEFLRTAEKDRMKFYEKENIFEKLLPIAIALNLGEKWAKACEGLMKQPPNWYQSDSMNLANFSTSTFVRSLNSFNNSATTSLTTAPRSASSAGSSGFGGGGFSGGGGGGGGGGSW